MSGARAPSSRPSPWPLSANAQAILLLTAPLITGSVRSSADRLSLPEYQRLAVHLRQIRRQPADLLAPDAADLLRACGPVIDDARLQRLVARGFLLSQAIERWQSRALWVISRADTRYPRRLKARLRDDAPPLLYGCGDPDLLAADGVAVVAAEALGDETEAGRLICGVLVGGLEQAAMRRAYRDRLLGGRLVLVSVNDPGEGAEADGVVQRDRLVRALADGG